MGSGRKPDPVIGSASRHGRPTASPGGALIGRDRAATMRKGEQGMCLTLDCCKRHAGRWWGGGGHRLSIVSFLSLGSPLLGRKNGPPWAVRVASSILLPRSWRGAFVFASSRRLLAKRRLPCFPGRSGGSCADPKASLTIGRVRPR
jgi:hypothetical protein